ncbi:MAG: Crp/Fnr family transcriptional regulator [Anaerolineae bacterium]|jgi:CRP/FNR family transcriptional regulator|nr:Crp/Fnr family transcriptional regulator [Chloroflexota bacterium]MBN8617474.1 Crp/Fnr family transcriptional regulator [Anaerolineae bacterium]MBN8637388.1 Crp/Fnr family transcriptional regulator [Anaerolineae bacterium]
MMIGVELLSKFDSIAGLSPRTQRCIAEKTITADVAAEASLYQQGDPPCAFYMLETGRVKLYRQSKDKRQILALLAPGECLGAESLSTGGISPFTATALTPVTALCVPPDPLQVLLDEHPDFQEVFLRLITDRLKQFVTLVHDLAFRDVTSRLAMVLVARADLEGKEVDDGVLLDRLLSQQEYADMVGTVREVVSRTFKRFEDENLVHLTRTSILIRDCDRLRAIALLEAR